MRPLEPEISVIMSVYNVEPYIRGTLDSVFGQTFDSFELIVIEDGSTDGTGNILHKYLEQYSEKMRVVFQENQGQGSSRNTALDMAKGKYVVFVDGDDTIEVNYLQTLYDTAEGSQSDVVICGYQKVDSKGKVIEKVSPKKEQDLFFLVRSLGCCGKMIRMDFLRQYNIKFASDKYYEDVSFSFLSSYMCEKISIIPYSGYLYLQRRGSTMTKKITLEKVPFGEIERSLQCILNRGKTNKIPLLEYGVMCFFTFFLFRVGRKNHVKIIGQLCDYMKHILFKYFPKFYNNSYLNLFHPGINMPMVYRVGILVFSTLCRFRLLKPFAMIVTRV